jgi:2-isopropylmalate synthase
VEFSAEDATRTAPEALERFAQAVVAAGAGVVNLPDTVGYTIPNEYGAIIARVARALEGKAIVSVHCHDDLGLAVANSLAGVQGGARQIECTINGIGERAGNCSLEEVVMAMRVRRDVLAFETGIETTQLFPASKLLTEIIGVGPQPNKAIVGQNAFAHEAGIHQDGFLKERTTYEIMEPRSVGVPESRLVLGKHSGRHALADRCKHLGYPLTAPQLDTVYQRFIAMCDHKKWLSDDEIGHIARDVTRTAAA